MKTFKNCCYCGGWATVEKGKPVEQPHGYGCAQRQEWEDWHKEMIEQHLPKQPCRKEDDENPE
jgi:hypothetical protein